MKVKMLDTRMGSPDGILVLSYKKGEQYELPERLARVFIAKRWAKAVKAPLKARRKKDNGAVLENKSETKLKKS